MGVGAELSHQKVGTLLLYAISTNPSIQGDPLQTVELLHNKKFFSNGQKKSPLLHIEQNMTPFTPFIILKKFFCPIESGISIYICG